ncbi:MAG: phosphoglucosamine mutase [Clostridiales bacterium]|nr:phosphoglucosamine mutase [Clostridiales bacterium]
MKYFGTDGIRGLYGESLTEDVAYRAGRAVAAHFKSGKVVLGRDTRTSGESLAHAAARGLADGGLDVLDAGIAPTPAVSYLTDSLQAAAGVMISASHNPPEYNGIKVFGARGRKLTEEQETAVEAFMNGAGGFKYASAATVKDSADGFRQTASAATVKDSADGFQQTVNAGAIKDSAGGFQQTFNTAAVKGGAGAIRRDGALLERYVAHIVGQFDFSGVKGAEIALDCGFGAAGGAAPEVFRRLGFKPKALHCEPRGREINRDCGALHPENIGRQMGGAVFGFAFDGDADRLSVNCKGGEIDGDSVLYNLSRAMALKDNVVVGTVLNNLALETTLARDGKKLIRTDVGDKYISALMFERGYNLGGEQSGHFIIAPDAQTGDGILAALWFMRSLYTGGGFREPERLALYAQGSISELAGKEVLDDPGFRALIDKHSRLFGGNGRILVRMSGTEPKARVMAEGADEARVREALEAAREYIRQWN